MNYQESVISQIWEEMTEKITEIVASFDINYQSWSFIDDEFIENKLINGVFTFETDDEIDNIIHIEMRINSIINENKEIAFLIARIKAIKEEIELKLS